MIKNIRKILIISLAIIITVSCMPLSSSIYAEDQEVFMVSTGQPGMHVSLSGDLKDDGTSITLEVLADDNGTAIFDEVVTSKEASLREATLEVNYPNKKPFEKAELPGGIAGKEGIRQTVLLSNEEVTYPINISLENIVFAEGYVYLNSEFNPLKGADVILPGDDPNLETVTVTTDEKGYFNAIPDTLLETAKTGKIKIEETDIYEGIEEDYSQFIADGNKIVLNEKYDAVLNRDYAFGDNITSDGYVKTAGSYIITGKNDSQIGASFSGPFSDSLTISVDENGNTDNIYIKNAQGKISKPVKNVIKLDNKAPVITNIDSVIETEGGNKINFTDHGMYTNEDARLTIKVSAYDEDSGTDKMFIYAKDGNGNTKRYMARTTVDENGSLTCSYIIERKLNQLLKEELYIYLIDKVGNESELKLIRNEKDPSTLTIESDPPQISAYREDGKCSEYGWYSDDINISFNAWDSESGLRSVTMLINGNNVISQSYLSKESGSKYFTFTLTKELIARFEQSDGKYTLLITASDNAGNTTSKSQTLYADIVSPEITLGGITEGYYYNRIPTLTVSNDEKYYDSEGAEIIAEIYRDGKLVNTKKYPKAKEANLSSEFKKNGKYKVKVYAVDAAGNTSEEKYTSFVIDTVAPEITLSGAENNKYYNLSKKITVAVKETNYDTNKVKISVTRILRGKKEILTFPWTSRGECSIESRVFKENGTYEIIVTSVDKAGNNASSKRLKFTVDTAAPKIRITGVTGKTYGYNDSVSPKILIDDDYYQNSSFSLTNQSGNTGKSFKKVQNTYGCTVCYMDFKKTKSNDGIYHLTVSASDKAGNNTRKSITFSVNRFGSTFEYDAALKEINGKVIKNVTKDLNIYEYNVSEIKKSTNEIVKDGELLEGTTFTKKSTSKNGLPGLRHVFDKSNFAKEGIYTINVVSKDALGNMVESRQSAGEIRFTVDRTAPVIDVDGLSEKIVKAKSREVKVKTMDALSKANTKIYVNDNEIMKTNSSKDDYLSFVINEGMKQKIKIVATDEAGNTSEYETVISITSSNFSYIINAYRHILIASGCFILLVISMVLIRVKRKGSDQSE